MKKKVVIIGAGPAGLTAAYELLKKDNKNYDVIIIEKDSLVGGISKTVNFNGNLVDTGIHRFFSKSEEVNKIWEDILPKQNKPSYDEILLNEENPYSLKGSDPEKDEKSLLIKKRYTRIYYGKKFYDYPVTLNFRTLKNLGFINIMKVGFSYLKSVFFKKEETSLENFYINRFGKKLYSMFFENYTEKVWGIHPKNIAADWGSQRVKGLSIIAVVKDMFKKLFHIKKERNTETSLIEKFVYPKLGAGQMWTEMKNEIEALGGKVILNAELKTIVIQNNNVDSVSYKQDKTVKTLKCDYCISSMAIKDLFRQLKTEKKIPRKIYDAAVKLPYRNFMSVCLIVDKINLKNTTNIPTVGNVLPDSWDYIQEPDVKMGRIQIFNNWSPYMFKNKEDIQNKIMLTLEYFCSENDEYWNMSDKEFIDFAIKEAIQVNLISSKNNVEDSYRIKIDKAYPGYFGTYEKMDDIISYLNKFSNLYCIGRNGQHRYNNMDHSMLTGIECANKIINSDVSKNSLWSINTEKEYHETKK